MGSFLFLLKSSFFFSNGLISEAILLEEYFLKYKFCKQFVMENFYMENSQSEKKPDLKSNLFFWDSCYESQENQRKKIYNFNLQKFISSIRMLSR